jgi:hypothetical protein
MEARRNDLFLSHAFETSVLRMRFLLGHSHRLVFPVGSITVHVCCGWVGRDIPCSPVRMCLAVRTPSQEELPLHVQHHISRSRPGRPVPMLLLLCTCSLLGWFLPHPTHLVVHILLHRREETARSHKPGEVVVMSASSPLAGRVDFLLYGRTQEGGAPVSNGSASNIDGGGRRSMVMACSQHEQTGEKRTRDLVWSGLLLLVVP